MTSRSSADAHLRRPAASRAARATRRSPRADERLQLLVAPSRRRRATGSSRRAAAPAAGCPPSRAAPCPAAYSGLPVVSSFSPKKIELAPAMKQSSCASSAHLHRGPPTGAPSPRGIRMRAVAIMRTMLDRRRPAAALPAACPSPRTSALIGTDSGCGSWLAQRAAASAAVVDRLAHADDAAAADGDAGVAHALRACRSRSS